MYSKPFHLDSKKDSMINVLPLPPNLNNEEHLAYEFQQESSSSIIPSHEIKCEKLIGSGGFSDVYQGRWFYSQEPIAIKKIKPDCTYTEDRQSLCKKEIKMMIQFNSPYLLKLFGVCIDKNEYSMILEFMARGDLYAFLKTEQKTGIGLELRHQIAKDIAYGLLYLHGHQIIHADLKSPNILLDRNLRAKIGDFGLSVKIDKKTPMSTLVPFPTVAWAAPEQFISSQVTFATDIFAFAVILWEIMSLQALYPGMSKKDIMNWVYYDNRLKIPLIPEPYTVYTQLITDGWQKNPVKRPSIKNMIDILVQINTPQANDQKPLGSPPRPNNVQNIQRVEPPKKLDSTSKTNLSEQKQLGSVDISPINVPRLIRGNHSRHNKINSYDFKQKPLDPANKSRDVGEFVMKCQQTLDNPQKFFSKPVLAQKPVLSEFNAYGRKFLIQKVQNLLCDLGYEKKPQGPYVNFKIQKGPQNDSMHTILKTAIEALEKLDADILQRAKAEHLGKFDVVKHTLTPAISLSHYPKLANKIGTNQPGWHVKNLLEEIENAIEKYKSDLKINIKIP